MRARIEYGPPVRLRNVTIYKLDSDGHLAEVDTAASAHVLPDKSWRLENGRYWRADFENRGDVLSTGENREEVEIPFRQRIVRLNLDPLWLHNKGLSPQYLWLSELRILSGAEIMSRDLSGYRTRLQALFSGPFFTWAMAMLGASLSMLYFAYQTRWRALVLVLLGGYLAHFAFKGLYLVGEFGYIHPLVAAWLPTFLLMCGVAGVVLTIQKRRGLGLRMREMPKFADEA
jgi:lipopolysaccharide export LptBFGC system permease protein LptF